MNRYRSSNKLLSTSRLYKSLTTSLVAFAMLSSSIAAQAFQLQNLQEERVHLSDFIIDGQWNLVMFWSTDCVPCEEQKPMIEAFHKAHRNSDAVVLGVALDGMEKKDEIDILIEKHAPSYPNLVVFTDVFHRQYEEMTGENFRATPTYLLFAPDGTLVGSRAGPIEREFIEGVISATPQ